MIEIEKQPWKDMVRHAESTYPNECCGLIEGVDTEEGWEALAVHEAANLAENPARRFLIDPQAQFDLLRTLRGTSRRVIGCFHSHPEGNREPSATDRAEASESNFLYLIAAGGPDTGFALNAYAFDEATKSFVKIPLGG